MNYSTIFKNIKTFLKSIISYAYATVGKYYKKALLKIFPAKLIATFLGTGYLPEWQGHWASFISIPIVALIVYVFTWFDSGDIILLSVPAVITTIILFFLGLLSIYVLHLKDSSANNEIMINIVFGQVMVLAFSAPAIVYLGGEIANFNDMICTKFMYCAPWFYNIVTYTPLLCVPFVAYRFVDSMKPWPASVLEKDYNNCFSKMFESLIIAIYTLLLLYLAAFMFFGLTMDEAILFFSGIFSVIAPDIDGFFIAILMKLNSIGLFKILFLQDYYDSLIAQYYNISGK